MILAWLRLLSMLAQTPKTTNWTSKHDASYKCGSTNGICSRRSYISSAPLLQSDSASVHKSSIREPSIRQSIDGGLERRRRQLSGWKIGVSVCAVTAVTVGLLNISLTIWAVTNHELINGISYLYTGSCSEVASMSLWIHLGINAMSTMLLSASNCKLIHNPSQPRES